MLHEEMASLVRENPFLREVDNICNQFNIWTGSVELKSNHRTLLPVPVAPWNTKTGAKYDLRDTRHLNPRKFYNMKDRLYQKQKMMQPLYKKQKLKEELQHFRRPSSAKDPLNCSFERAFATFALGQTLDDRPLPFTNRRPTVPMEDLIALDRQIKKFVLKPKEVREITPEQPVHNVEVKAPNTLASIDTPKKHVDLHIAIPEDKENEKTQESHFVRNLRLEGALTSTPLKRCTRNIAIKSICSMAKIDRNVRMNESVNRKLQNNFQPLYLLTSMRC